MARPSHYVPVISRSVVAVLYHEAKRRRIPMTRLVDALLLEALRGTPGWEVASHDYPELTGGKSRDRARA